MDLTQYASAVKTRTAPAHEAASHVRSTVTAGMTTPEERADRAVQVVGFRIMKQTEIAPGWWGQPVEVGETGSGTVAHQFCTGQNKVTMQLNRPKMIEFFAEPIYTEPTSPADATPIEVAV